MNNIAAEWLAGPERGRTRFGMVPRYREGLHRVSKRAYAWMVPNGSWGETNLGLVDCGGVSVLVDTAWDLGFTLEFLQAARGLVERSPIECLVNTHADGDHCWGNQLFADRRIIGSHACIAQMDHIVPSAVRALKGAGRWMGHVPLGGLAELGRYVESMFEPYAFDGIKLTKPNEGFYGERTLTFGGVEIVIREVGPGHTDGDAVVYVPGERVAYAGDILFVGVTPVIWSGPVESVLAGLRYLLSLRADVFVPGHGPFATRGDIQSVIDYWDFVHEAVHQRFRVGMEPAKAARDVLFNGAFGQSTFARWDSPERLVTSAYTMYRNWGHPRSRLPEKLATMNLLRHQAQVAFSLRHTTGA